MAPFETIVVSALPGIRLEKTGYGRQGDQKANSLAKSPMGDGITRKYWWVAQMNSRNMALSTD
jgi:hypothetical protein